MEEKSIEEKSAIKRLVVIDIGQIYDGDLRKSWYFVSVICYVLVDDRQLTQIILVCWFCYFIKSMV